MNREPDGGIGAAHHQATSPGNKIQAGAAGPLDRSTSVPGEGLDPGGTRGSPQPSGHGPSETQHVPESDTASHGPTQTAQADSAATSSSLEPTHVGEPTATHAIDTSPARAAQAAEPRTDVSLEPGASRQSSASGAITSPLGSKAEEVDPDPDPPPLHYEVHPNQGQAHTRTNEAQDASHAVTTQEPTSVSPSVAPRALSVSPARVSQRVSAADPPSRAVSGPRDHRDRAHGERLLVEVEPEAPTQPTLPGSHAPDVPEDCPETDADGLSGQGHPVVLGPSWDFGPDTVDEAAATSRPTEATQ